MGSIDQRGTLVTLEWRNKLKQLECKMYLVRKFVKRYLCHSCLEILSKLYWQTANVIVDLGEDILVKCTKTQTK